MTVTVGEFLFQCLQKEGIDEIFGVPGDFNFPLLDTLETYEGMELIDNRNELNAGYAANGYAHVKGMGALITTFGVGELSASNAIAGSYSENIPLIHIIGSPDLNDQQEGQNLHHSLMDGDFDVFRKMHAHITGYAVKITAENAGIEIPKAIRIAREKKKPVYLDCPMDQVLEPVGPLRDEEAGMAADNKALQAAVEEAEQRLDQAANTVLLVDFNTLRYNLEPYVETLAEKMNVPVAQMLQGKGGFDEEHPQYIGMYAGAFGDSNVRARVEDADCIIAVGLLWSDFNTAKYTADLDPEKMIIIHPHSMIVTEKAYKNIYAADALKALQKLEYREAGPVESLASIYDTVVGAPEEKLAAAAYYPRFQKMLKQDDVMIIDTGTLSYGMSQVKLPSGAFFISHGAWQSIGYATPAALGAAIASDDRRVLLFIGEGALQFTIQELSTLIENGCKPIVFILNNQGYTIERYLNIDHPFADYNDIPRWDHMTLAEGFAGSADIFKAVVRTNGELDAAIQKAEQYDGMSLIELVVTDPMDAPQYLLNMRENEK
ncbi:alpha-keto acid decarboxylase family protein [Salinicoccus albus]|uniref:alpha-keto acid decarboxylase family protein n=1 Tax=Salinicoccus albus TaxID=418756 RepID=UPI00036DF0AB|nr:thiamine pyrophosphate-binding protein [Salinicoccus albus]